MVPNIAALKPTNNIVITPAPNRRSAPFVPVGCGGLSALGGGVVVAVVAPRAATNSSCACVMLVVVGSS
jgi:hypothetical protein